MAKPDRGVPAAGLAAVLAATLLAGCAFTPATERPPLPVASVYPTTSAGAPSGVAAADLDWRRFYADARLARLIELALVNNRDLRVAVLNVEQARATYDIRRADQWPTVNAGAVVNRASNAFGKLDTTYSVGLAVSGWELDLFGRVKSLSGAALEQYLASAETRQSVQLALVAQVATTYIQLLADEELLRVTRDTLGTRDESARLTKLRFDNGASSALDYNQSLSLLEGARASLAQITRQRELDQNALVLLVGQPLPADLPPAGPLAGVLAGADVPAGLPSDLLERRPDIRAAEHALRAANANIGAARAAFFPRISLTASYGTGSTELDGLFKSGSFAFTGTGQLLQPLFDYGRNRANLASAQVGRDIAVSNYEKAIQSAFRDVSDALAGRATFGEQLRAQQAQADALEQTFRLADLRYKNGAASYLDTLDAQRSLYTAQQALLQVRAQQLQNAVALYRALGGGWSEADGAAVGAAAAVASSASSASAAGPRP